MGVKANTVKNCFSNPARIGKKGTLEKKATRFITPSFDIYFPNAGIPKKEK